MKFLKIAIFAAIFSLFGCANSESKLPEVELPEIMGHEIKFDYEGHPVERDIAFRYLWYHYSLDDSIRRGDFFDVFGREDIGIALYDIDDDGEKEIFVYLKDVGACGSAGCHFEILKKAKPNSLTSIAGYDRIFWSGEGIDSSSLTVPEVMIVLDSTNLGVHDIYFMTKSIWRWQGEYYDWLGEPDIGNDF